MATRRAVPAHPQGDAPTAPPPAVCGSSEHGPASPEALRAAENGREQQSVTGSSGERGSCLLYTSDAADDM
eukprot:6682702-Alexandrium_andersonii.AAC.1